MRRQDECGPTAMPTPHGVPGPLSNSLIQLHVVFGKWGISLGEEK